MAPCFSAAGKNKNSRSDGRPRPPKRGPSRDSDLTPTDSVLMDF